LHRNGTTAQQDQKSKTGEPDQENEDSDDDEETAFEHLSTKDAWFFPIVSASCRVSEISPMPHLYLARFCRSRWDLSYLQIFWERLDQLVSWLVLLVHRNRQRMEGERIYALTNRKGSVDNL